MVICGGYFNFCKSLNYFSMRVHFLFFNNWGPFPFIIVISNDFFGIIDVPIKIDFKTSNCILRAVVKVTQKVRTNNWGAGRMLFKICLGNSNEITINTN